MDTATCAPIVMLLRFLVVQLLWGGVDGAAEAHRYCVIGAGPAGVQLGNFFLTADGDDGTGRDYVVLERAKQSAQFFSEFPVHRVLNSINRRFTRSGDLEFNLRHDWNSLLGSEKTVGLFTSWSEEYWPPADRLVEYINAFAAPQVKQNKIRYCHDVKQVQQVGSSFRITAEQTCDPASCTDNPADSANDFAPIAKTFECQVVVMANGMQKPRIVDDWITDVNRFSIRYDQLRNVDPRTFTNKSVLVLGEGNAAGETGDNLRNYARDMVFVSRYRGAKTLQQTRYVGDTRARRTTYLDANIFKSYEGQTAMGLGSDQLVAAGCDFGSGNVKSGYGDKPAVCFFTVEEGVHVVLAPIVDALAGLIDETREAFGELVYTRPAPAQLAKHAAAGNRMFGIANFPAADVLCISVEAIRKELTPQQMALLPKLRDTTKYTTAGGMEFQKPFDAVITSLGWQYDDSVFSGNVKPEMLGHPKRPDQRTYPSLTPEFESSNTPGLYVIGAASHGLDRYRYQASGGFIHGFRFNVRTLFRILETRFETQSSDYGPWGTRTTTPLAGASQSFDWEPSSSVDLGSPHGQDFGTNTTSIEESPLYSALLARLNNAGGPYEQVGGALSDAILFDCARKKTWYIEDVPEDMVHERYKDYGRLVWSYYYGTQDVALRETSLLCGVRSARTAQLGTFIHPVLMYFPAGAEWPVPLHWTSKPTVDHPSIYWVAMDGVSRVHLPDQFVWGDWADHETLGVLEVFLEAVEAAAGGFCMGSGDGRVDRPFDEKYDVQWREKKFQERLKRQAGECWKSGVGTPESNLKKAASFDGKVGQKAQSMPRKSTTRADPSPTPSPAKPAGRTRRKRAAQAESTASGPAASGPAAAPQHQTSDELIGHVQEVDPGEPPVGVPAGKIRKFKFSQ